MSIAFATLADLQARFAQAELVQLTDDELTGGIDEARVAQSLASACALVQGYVSATYQLDPAAPIPLILVDVTCDIARHKLYRTSPPEDVTVRHAQAIRTLEGIRGGKVKLDLGTEAIAPRQGKVLVQSGIRQVARDQMTSF